MMNKIKFLNEELQVKDLVVTGNLNVTGSTVTEDAEHILTKGAVTVINADNNELEQTLMGTVIRTGKTDDDGKYIDYAMVYDPLNEAVRLGVGIYEQEANVFIFNDGEGYPIAVRNLTNNGSLVMWDAENYCLVDAPLQNGSGFGSIQSLGSSATGTFAIALGTGTGSRGEGSFAEGSSTLADGDYSHAEGYEAKALKAGAHAEGLNCIADCEFAHAEGDTTVANGWASHAGGVGTFASGYAQTAIGKYNKKIFDALFIVGNGSGDEDEFRSNAFEVISGENGTYATVGDQKIATESYVDSHSSNINLPLQQGNDETSMVFNEGIASGGYSIAGGTTDKTFIEEAVGSILSSITTLHKSEARGDLSIALGADNIANTGGSIAMGYDNLSGGKGYYFDNFDGNTITLSTTRRTTTWTDPSYPSSVDWAVGDRLFMINEDRVWLTITAVDGNKITVAEDIGEVKYKDIVTVFTYSSPNDRTIININKPESGVVNIGWGAIGIGTQNTVLGSNSYAVGYKNTAVGDFSAVFGQENLAGYSAFATGIGNKAKGKASFAEGDNTTASGRDSHSEGYYTIASGNHSHAEGWNSIATAFAAHSEGGNTEASDEYAHAEGYGSKAYGKRSHAEGSRTLALGEASHTEGNSTNDVAVDKNVSVPALIDNWNNTKFLMAKGDSSHAEGEDTLAAGNFSHSEGFQTIAKGVKSHAEGNKTYAFGDESHAEGSNTRAYGATSHTEGYAVIARGEDSHAEGTRTTTLGTSSHAEGASTGYSETIEILDNYTKDDILTEWESYKFTLVAGTASHGEGQDVLVLDDYSHAEGFETIAQGKKAHAQGNRTRAIGDESHAEGSRTEAIGPTSHAEGYLTKAIGENSHAEGYLTEAWGENSHAEGENTKAHGNNSHAGGIGTRATAEAQTVIGRYNEENPDALFIVGNGTKRTEGSSTMISLTNAFEVISTTEGVSIKIGSTTITETQLQGLLALLGN